MQGRSRELIQEMLEPSGVAIDGENPWDILVRDERLFDRLIKDASLGLGESYMDGWWDSEALDECIAKLVLARLDERVKKNPKTLMLAAKSRLLNLQSHTRAFEVGERHYDIGNDLYEAMLDKRMLYTCGYWRDAKTLDEAQEAKLELVCRKIGIRPGMKILELGCGWGSFARYAAERYGAHVTGVTVSKEQVRLGMERCKGLPVELKLADYRSVGGEYDAVISIGIMEHVGYKNYRGYMETAHRCLKDEGVAFIHTIGRNDSTTMTDPWIHKYIFPNGMLPSIAQLGAAMDGLFVMEDWHNFGPDYDRTLMAWHENFERAWPKLADKYGERFRRMWRYYLLCCAGAFRARSQQLWQIVMTKTGRPQPDCRVT